jgi:DNA-directed RNA polymerase specialized sigma24 family protein
VEWERVLPAERARLVRLCLQLTGSAEWAEDLAQETLYEACCGARQLRDPGRRAQWLRRRQRDAAHASPLRPDPSADAPDGAPALPEDVLADGFDGELELERAELVRLVDCAMGL